MTYARVLITILIVTTSHITSYSIDQNFKLNDSVPVYRWSISTDLLNLFRSGQSNVLLRKDVSSKLTWRMSLNFDWNRYNTTGATSSIVTHQYSIFVSPGLEKRFSRGRHKIYNGFDCEIGLSGTTQNLNKLPGSVGGQAGFTSFSISPGYFLGFNYQLLDRMSIWSEAVLQVNFSRTNFTSELPDKNQFFVRFNPLRFIGISYHF